MAKKTYVRGEAIENNSITLDKLNIIKLTLHEDDFNNGECSFSYSENPEIYNKFDRVNLYGEVTFINIYFLGSDDVRYNIITPLNLEIDLNLGLVVYAYAKLNYKDKIQFELNFNNDDRLIEISLTKQ